MSENNRVAEIKKSLEGMDGWFGDNEGEFLYSHAKRITGKGVILEIGSWKGRSTVWLSNASRETSGQKVYAVDPHTGSPEHHEKFGEVYTFDIFKENIKQAGVEDMVVPIKKTSEDAAREWDGTPIEFLWIDGDHSYEMVKLDYELWSPFLVDGGIIAFHDTDRREGPRRFVEQFIFKSRQFKNVSFFETITVATKVSKNTFADRLRNRWTLLIKRVYQNLRHSKIPRPQFMKNASRALIKKFGRT